jgi:glycosyltransferase involved in cell wall biosynthesis
MKILYYSSHPNLSLNSQSGYGTHFREMIKAFRTLGHEVSVLVMGGEEKEVGIAQKESGLSIKQKIKPFVPAKLWASMKDFSLIRFDSYAKQTLEARVKGFNPDVIYERSAYLQTSGVEVAREYKIPHFMEINSPHIEEAKVFQGDSWYEKKAIDAESKQVKYSDRLLPVSSALKNFLIKSYVVPIDKFTVLPNAIDPNKLEYSQFDAEAISSKYGLEDKTVIGFVGSIFPWHGIDKMIEAISQIKSLENIKALIVGDGEILPDLKQQSQDLGLLDTIIFTGKVPHKDVFAHIECMDITIMADSNSYGSPVKIFEYGGMGKAIIAPDNIPVRDVMEDGKDGILVKPNANSIRKAMETLIENPELRKNMAQNFQQKVLDNYKWIDNAKRVISEYDKLDKEIKSRE